jgi:hypothetical protein
MGALPIGEMDRPAKRNQAGFLDCLRESGMRRHTVRNGLDRRLGIKGDDANLDHVTHVRPDHHEAEPVRAQPGRTLEITQRDKSGCGPKPAPAQNAA